MRKGSVSVGDFRPDLVKYWSARNEKTPFEVARGSGYKAWWWAECGHEWQARVDNRCYNNAGCPFCTVRGWKKILPGKNDLETLYPEMARQWHPTLNGDLLPSEVLPGVKKHVWWLCLECGREWRASLNTRTARGTGCPSCRGRKRGVENAGTQHCKTVVEEWHPDNPLTLKDYSVSSNFKALWRCGNGHEWRATINDRNGKLTGCKSCGFGGTSAAEQEVVTFVQTTGVQVRSHSRRICPAFEYDAVIEDRKIIIEYNGVYWHSERFKPGTDYHLRKTLAANTAGYQLIHVWEDDWVYRRPVVEKMLKRKLGVSEEPRLNARSLTFREVSSAESSKFLEESHIQGASGGSWRGGLFAGEELVALMVMKRRSEGVYELVRFATSAIVRGGHSKLLKRAIEDLSPREVVTFSDNCVSGGELYARAGFERVKELAPDYMYRVGQRREHKFNYRKARFERDPNLKYEEGLTERELADLNGLDRVYDAGKVKWLLTCK